MTASEIAARIAASGAKPVADHMTRIGRESRACPEAERRAHERLLEPWVAAGLVIRHGDGSLEAAEESVAQLVPADRIARRDDYARIMAQAPGEVA